VIGNCSVFDWCQGGSHDRPCGGEHIVTLPYVAATLTTECVDWEGCWFPRLSAGVRLDTVDPDRRWLPPAVCLHTVGGDPGVDHEAEMHPHEARALAEHLLAAADLAENAQREVMSNA